MISRKKIWLYDSIAAVIIISVIMILYKQTAISSTQIFIGVVGCSLVLAIVSAIVYFKIKLIKFFKEEWKFRLSLLFKVFSIMHSKYDERMIETIFAYFTHYYNLNVLEISQDREFPKEEFPEGSFELVKVFVYITQLRKRNKKLLSRIDYIICKSSPVLFNMSFSHLRFKINKNYELQITGDNDDPMSYTQYKLFETKVVNALYDTDTQIARWLIKNRNHFGF